MALLKGFKQVALLHGKERHREVNPAFRRCFWLFLRYTTAFAIEPLDSCTGFRRCAAIKNCLLLRLFHDADKGAGFALLVVGEFIGNGFGQPCKVWRLCESFRDLENKVKPALLTGWHQKKGEYRH